MNKIEPIYDRKIYDVDILYAGTSEYEQSYGRGLQFDRNIFEWSMREMQLTDARLRIMPTSQR